MARKRRAATAASPSYCRRTWRRVRTPAAVDEDAAGVIQEGLATVLREPDVRRWHDTLIFTLVEAVERHPLARRLLAGLEPEVTVRVLEIPALNELRKACTEMLRNGQAAGTVRVDIDPAAVGNGVIALMLAVLMSVTQIGTRRWNHCSSDLPNWSSFVIVTFGYATICLGPRRVSVGYGCVAQATNGSFGFASERRRWRPTRRGCFVSGLNDTWPPPGRSEPTLRADPSAHRSTKSGPATSANSSSSG